MSGGFERRTIGFPSGRSSPRSATGGRDEILDRKSAAGIGAFQQAVGQVPIVAMEVHDLLGKRRGDELIPALARNKEITGAGIEEMCRA